MMKRIADRSSLTIAARGRRSARSPRPRSTTTIDPNQAAQVLRIAIPFPDLAPPGPSTAIRAINAPSSRRSRATSPPPASSPSRRSRRTSRPRPISQSASARTTCSEAQRLERERRTTSSRRACSTPPAPTQFGKRYRGPAARSRRSRTCSPTTSCARSTASPASSSRRSPSPPTAAAQWEIWLMDWDGAQPAPDHASQRAVDPPELVARQRADGLHLVRARHERHVHHQPPRRRPHARAHGPRPQHLGHVLAGRQRHRLRRLRATAIPTSTSSKTTARTCGG